MFYEFATASNITYNPYICPLFNLQPFYITQATAVNPFPVLLCEHLSIPNLNISMDFFVEISRTPAWT